MTFHERVRDFLTGLRDGGEAGGASGDAGSTSGDDAGEAERPDPAPESKLFHCPECEVVYLALEKEQCSTCRTEVTQVSPASAEG